MESFHSSLEIERANRKVYRAQYDGRADVFDYFDRSCNQRRRHSEPGCISPTEFEVRPMSSVPAKTLGTEYFKHETCKRTNYRLVPEEARDMRGLGPETAGQILEGLGILGRQGAETGEGFVAHSRDASPGTIRGMTNRIAGPPGRACNGVGQIHRHMP